MDQPQIHQQTRPSEREGFCSIQPNHWGQGRFVLGEEQPHFCKELLGPNGYSEDRTLDQAADPSPVRFCLFSLRVLKGEICSDKSHISIKTPGEEKGL